MSDVEEKPQVNLEQIADNDLTNIEPERRREAKIKKMWAIRSKIFQALLLGVGILLVFIVYLIVLLPRVPWIALSSSVLILFGTTLFACYAFFADKNFLSKKMVQRSYIITGLYTIFLFLGMISMASQGDIAGIFRTFATDLVEATEFDRWTATLIYTLGVLPLLSTTFKEMWKLGMSHLFTFED